MPPQRGVEPLGALLFQHPLAVGRVADENAGLGGQIHFGGVAVGKAEDVADPRFPGVGHGEGDAFGVVVRAENLVFSMEFLRLRFFPNRVPDAAVIPGKGLRREPAAAAGGGVPGDQRRLDGNGAGAAEGVPQKFPSPVAGQLNHGGGQGLPQGRVVAHGAVAPLVKAGAGGVQIQLRPVVHDGELQLVLCPGLREPADAVFLPQTPGGGLFHDGLTVRDAHKLAV